MSIVHALAVRLTVACAYDLSDAIDCAETYAREASGAHSRTTWEQVADLLIRRAAA